MAPFPSSKKATPLGFLDVPVSLGKESEGLEGKSTSKELGKLGLNDSGKERVKPAAFQSSKKATPLGFLDVPLTSECAEGKGTCEELGSLTLKSWTAQGLRPEPLNVSLLEKPWSLNDPEKPSSPMASTYCTSVGQASSSVYNPTPGTSRSSSPGSSPGSACVSPAARKTDTPKTPAFPLPASSLRATVINNDVTISLIDEGVGGSYFVKVGRKKIGVYKPSDEEPCAYNNPKGYADEDDNEKGNIKPGDGYKREVAAYLLDHYHYARVPETIELQMPNRLFEKKDDSRGCKLGSLQKFVQNSDGTPCKASCDMGPGSFPIDDVHRIGQLDIRLLNCDRHGGNALIQRDGSGGIRLLPIDHSYVLPGNVQDLDFEWLFWPQSKEPFSVESQMYIAALEPDRDARTLRQLGIEEECIELMKAATITLQIGCKLGLSLRTIGRFMRRELMYELSGFENVVLQSRRALELGGDIEFSRLRELLHNKFAGQCESPTVRPVRTRPVTLKETVLSEGVEAKLVSRPGDNQQVYIIRNEEEEPIATFKPWDSGDAGKNYIREKLAYRMDYNNWAGVPETTEMRLPNAWFPTEEQCEDAPFRQGSVQKYVPGADGEACVASSVNPKAFSNSQVHRLGILDLRLGNKERRSCDVLVAPSPAGGTYLYPIAHAQILPSSLDHMELAWLRWPQSKVPFSEDELDYLYELDHKTCAHVLEALDMAPECIETQKAATFVVKVAARLGLTLYQIGSFFCRKSLVQPSALEELLVECRAALDDGGHIDFDLLTELLPGRLREFRAQCDDSDDTSDDSAGSDQETDDMPARQLPTVDVQSGSSPIHTFTFAEEPAEWNEAECPGI